MSTPMLGPEIDALRAAHHRVEPEPSIATHATDQTKTFAAKIGAWTYPLAWTGIYSLHVACAIYYFLAGMLFQSFKNSAAAFEMDFYLVTIPSKYAEIIAGFHYAIGVVHCSFLVMAFIRFIYPGVLRMYHWSRRGAVVQPSDRTTSIYIERLTSAIPHSLERYTLSQLPKSVKFVYRHILSDSGLLGVEFRYVDTFFLVREIVETILQSHQAYEMCRLLTRPVLNRFFVATLVVNCWATPIVHHFVPSKAMQRLLVRLCDVVLDFVASVGVPAILTVDYVKSYDPTLQDFPYELWYDDKWFVNAMKESPLIMFGSWIDAVGRLTFSIGLIASLHDIKLLLKRKPDFSIKPAATELKQMATMKLRLSRPATPKSKHSRLLTIAHRLMFLYGFAVLGVHLEAELRQSPTKSCLLEVRPWLVSRPACSLVEVNCWRDRKLTGDADDFEYAIGSLDALSLTQITFRHCPQIEIPPSVKNYNKMIGIKFYNSTIVAWDDQAALRESYHDAMRYLIFVRTTFTNGILPPGLISPDFPVLLVSIQFIETNLHWLPDDLDKIWPIGTALFVEFSELTEVSPTFARANFDSVSIISNKITQVPAALFESPWLRMFSVIGNPINELPTDVDMSGSALTYFQIDGTNVFSVPPWVGEWIGTTMRSVTAGRTPWCDEVVLKANQSVNATTPWLKRIFCKDSGSTSMYPIDVDVRPEEEIW